MVLDPACLDQHRHQTSIQHHVLLSGCLQHMFDTTELVQVPLLFEVSSITKWIKVWGNMSKTRVRVCGVLVWGVANAQS